MAFLSSMRPRSGVALALPLAIAAFACSSSNSSGTGGSGGATGAGLSVTSGGPQTGTNATGTGTSTSSSQGGNGPSLKGTQIGEYTGVNGLIADNPDDLAPLGWVREYHNWGWLCDNFGNTAYPGLLYTPNLPENGWSWDDFYSKINAGGGHAFPAVQGSVPWMNNSAVPPVEAGADKTLAASYIAHGDSMYQMAARYGSTMVPDAKLKLRADQMRSSGLGTLQYFEDFNEQDNAAAFTPDAFAAMASADYDGNQSQLGDTIGIKNADPNAKLVMGGLSGKYPTTNWVKSITDFLDGMRTWSATNRGGSFPADVINVHLYSFGPGNGQPGISPEDDGIEEKLAAISAYRDQNLPGKELWWTEFGYDTYNTSILRAPALGGNSEYIVQGQWIVRDFLAGLAAGFDKATLFELDDTCKVGAPGCNAGQQFTTCGLIDGNHTKKASWYFVTAFRSRLKTMVYTGKQTASDPDILIYQFKDAQSAGGALVVWAKTSSAKVVSGYSLALPAGATTAKAVTLADQQMNGVEADLTPAGGNATLDVTETPTIVLVDKM